MGIDIMPIICALKEFKFLLGCSISQPELIKGDWRRKSRIP